MEQTLLILLFLGIILTIIGYYENNSKCPKQKVIVKFIDKTLEEAQKDDEGPNKKFIRMFSDPPLLF